MQVNEEDRISVGKPANASNGMILGLVLLALVLAGAAWYYFGNDDEVAPQEDNTAVNLPEPAPEQPLLTEATLPEPDNSTVNTPPAATVTSTTVANPTVVEEAPLPALADSDQYVHDKVVQMADGMAIAPLLNDTDMVRQFVVFVDNLAQGELARKTSPMKAPTQKFTVSDITNKTYLDPDSYHRYDIYADFLSGLNDQQLLATYKRLSPLMEQAFKELGYPDVTFSQRLQQAIGVLMATPVIEEPIELSSVSVNYKFADPQLESLPNAQKLLVRMGPDNTRKIKKALRQLQTLLPQK